MNARRKLIDDMAERLRVRNDCDIDGNNVTLESLTGAAIVNDVANGGLVRFEDENLILLGCRIDRCQTWIRSGWSNRWDTAAVLWDGFI